MAPTEILAEQHAATLRDLLAPLGLPVHLLTGRLRQPQRREARCLLSADPALAGPEHRALLRRVETVDLGGMQAVGAG